ncbi:MAG: hypothetical protein FWB74_02360 [Defluviitaleaceae bacterium]|nr:hypothetical protein [Defluviitaleaceae bacterium]
MFVPKKRKKGLSREDQNAILERARTEEPLELEKGDMLAIILAAFKVFLPFVLGIAGFLILIAWLFMLWAS